MSQSESKNNKFKSLKPESEEDEDVDQNKWGNKIQFIFSAIGLVVGLGNVWKFPSSAYENGGSAFLIPYVICAFLFCLPVIYSEFIIGQYTQQNPAKAFLSYAPAFQGIGMFTLITASTVAVFYALVIAWSMLYFGFAIGARSDMWTSCKNSWNSPNCISSVDNKQCRDLNSSFPFFFNGSCISEPPPNATNGAEEFFINYVTTRSSGITDFDGFNWPIAICLFFLWLLVAATNIKGIRFFGIISYVTVPLPYVVILILFIRGVTLEGSWEGVKMYLFQPDMTKLINYKTWAAALVQACFSLTLGQGAHVSLSSHNKKNNNCFRDACIVILFDTLMSVVGGLAVFSTLGYLATQTGKNLTEVVKSGPSLTFIVYPEAIATMHVSWLWNMLLFIMLFFLGFSSEVALVELLTGFLSTSFPKVKKWTISLICSSILCSAGMVMATNAGWYWFNLMSDFAALAGPCVAIILQSIMLMYVYGWKHVKEDMEEMFGRPRTAVRRFFSRQSLFFAFSWGFICPLLALAVAVLSSIRSKIPMSIGDYEIPIWAEVFGWFINFGPIVCVPVYLVINIIRLKKKGLGFIYLFRPSKEMPSHDRYYRKTGKIPPDGFNDEEKNPLSLSSVYESTKSGKSQKQI